MELIVSSCISLLNTSCFFMLGFPPKSFGCVWLTFVIFIIFNNRRGRRGQPRTIHPPIVHTKHGNETSSSSLDIQYSFKTLKITYCCMRGYLQKYLHKFHEGEIKWNQKCEYNKKFKTMYNCIWNLNV